MKGASRSRGGFGRLGRAFSVLRNYGISDYRIESALESFSKFLRRSQAPATFACPSTLLGRSQELVRFLKDFDVAIHGSEHIDYKNVPPERMERDLGRAIKDFESSGLEPSGFRAPYLRWNDDLVRAIAKSGLSYDSSCSVFWDVGEGRSTPDKEIRKVLDFYSSEIHGETTSLPRIEEGVVRIPVSLPDDEILVERCMLTHPEDQLSYWTQMLLESYEHSELLVLQIHPERFGLCEDALSLLLAEVRKREIWVATLGEVATWWSARNKASASVDEKGRIDFEGPDDMVVRIRSETKEKGDTVPPQSLMRISPGHPLRDRALELGFVLTEDASGYHVEEDITRETELIRIGRRNGLLHKALWPHGYNSAFCLTGDIDALSVGDFLRRYL